MKHLLNTVALFFVFISGWCQFTLDYLRAADNYFRAGDYYSAAVYYERYLGSASDKEMQNSYRPYAIKTSSKKAVAAPLSNRQQAVYNAAESYRLLHYFEKAEPFYDEAMTFDKAAFPLAAYWNATVKRALGKYAEAEKNFTSFLGSYSNNDAYREAATREINNLKFIQAELSKKDIQLFTVRKTSSAIDTGAVYAPVWMNSNTLLLTSTKSESAGSKKQEHLNRLYQASFSNGEIGALQKLDLMQPEEIHQGVGTLTADGNTIFFTRWSMENGKKISSVYSSTRSGNNWTSPQAVTTLNANNYNTQQPFILPGGKYLLFASDRPGSVGGFDIWQAELDASNKPFNVINLGEQVNTKFDEQAPYFHAASGTLVFSSNGRVGMGGLDFFYSKGSPGNWAMSQNFGYPVNSIKDDIYFISRGDGKNILADVLISSDRDAACCLQLFSVTKQMPPRQIQGLVVACDTRMPLEGAVLTIQDTVNNRIVYSKTTDASGTYTFTLDDYQPLKAVAVLPGYHSGSITFNAPSEESALVLNNPEICLSRIPEVGAVIVLENVYFEFNKARILDESETALNNLVELLNQNPNMEIEISGHTDDVGNDEYNRRLSEARAQSVVNYVVSKGIDKKRLRAVGYGEKRPVAPNKHPDGRDNPEGREKNRRTEFKVLRNE